MDTRARSHRLTEVRVKVEFTSALELVMTYVNAMIDIIAAGLDFCIDAVKTLASSGLFRRGR